MNAHLKRLTDTLIAKPKIIFLIDGLGAVLTSFLLSVILTSFHEYFKMPLNTLQLLSLIAFVFAIYSLSCFALLDNQFKELLRPIIAFNLIYCVLTIGLAIHFYNELTFLGLVYFVGEVLIILGLVYIEIKIVKAL